ncbi:TPA: winged helix-turn-helix transcriptional regulator [Aeromonas veronii]
MKVETQVEKRFTPPLAILAELVAEPAITLKQVAERIGKSTSTVDRAVAVLVKEGRLRFVGPRKSGRWKVLDSERVNHLAPQLTDSGLARHRQVFPACRWYMDAIILFLSLGAGL